MALTDFLFNGKPPESVTSYGSTSQNTPTWYNDYVQGLIGKANALASSEWMPYNQQRLASPTANQEQAWRNIGDQTNLFTANNAANPFNQARNLAQGVAGQTALGQYNNAGLNALGQAQTNYQPTFGAAIGSTFGNLNTRSPDTLSNYFSPFQQALSNNVNRLGAQNLQNAISGINDRYIGGGGWGGSRMGAGIGNAIRQNLADTGAQQAQLSQTAFNQALGASQADLQRQLQGAQQLGQLAGAGSQNLQSIANQYGNFGQQDLNRQLQTAAQLGTLGGQQAQTGLTQNQALAAAGLEQQQQQQRGLDLAYQDFQRQRQDPFDKLGILNASIRGLNIPTSTSVSQTAPYQGNVSSPLAQIGGAGAGLAALMKAFG